MDCLKEGEAHLRPRARVDIEMMKKKNRTQHVDFHAECYFFITFNYQQTHTQGFMFYSTAAFRSGGYVTEYVRYSFTYLLGEVFCGFRAN
jgi:hypothetical protein